MNCEIASPQVTEEQIIQAEQTALGGDFASRQGRFVIEDWIRYYHTTARKVAQVGNHGWQTATDAHTILEQLHKAGLVSEDAVVSYYPSSN